MLAHSQKKKKKKKKKRRVVSARLNLLLNYGGDWERGHYVKLMSHCFSPSFNPPVSKQVSKL